MTRSTKSKVALVTGGSKGLGSALVSRFISDDNCSVVSCARHLPPGTVSENPSHTFIKADVSQEKEVDRLVSAVLEKHNTIDILVNNVGYGGKLEKAWLISSEQFKIHWINNFMSSVWTTRLVLPLMLDKGHGTIVYVSSQAGKRAVPGVSAYSASKFALVGFAQAVAKEISGSGVKVLTVCPAGMNTSMREELFHDSGKQQSVDTVAGIISDVISGVPDLPNGSEVLIRDGKIIHVECSRTF